MDPFEFNKVFGALLSTAIFILVSAIVASSIFEVHKVQKSGYELQVNNAKSNDSGKTKEKQESIAMLLAKANLDKGKKNIRVCATCHTFDKNGKNKIGPNLYNIVGQKIGNVKGFKYSKAILKKKEEQQKWTYENLNSFLKNPRKFIKGTKMSYLGERKDTRRANIILYLRSLSDNPMPLPQPEKLENTEQNK